MSNRSKIENNAFIQAARGYKNKEVAGLNLDKDKTTTRTMRRFGEGDLMFMEELIGHADESGVVKPWLENLVSPDYEIKEDLDFPKYNLEIEHVFGYKVEDTRQNLFFIGTEEILYMSGSLGIIQNIDDYSQTLFGGFINKGDKECHDNDIMCLSYYEGDVSMVATGQRGLKPTIFVWSPYDTSVVYGKFNLPKGTKEVSTIEFDYTGRYILSTGKDDLNTVFVYDLQTKDLVFSQETNDKTEQSFEYLMDITSNGFRDEFSVVGVNKIFFGNVGLSTLSNNKFDPQNKRNIDDDLVVFTCTYFISEKVCLIGNDLGELLVFDEMTRDKFWKKKLTSGSIQNITNDDIFKRVFITDSRCNVFILDRELKDIDSYRMPFYVKALDVNQNNEIAMGLSDGSIVIKYYKEKNKREETIVKSHFHGTISDVAFIPDSRIVTSGDDNRILIWNLRSKKCEEEGKINEPLFITDPATGKRKFHDNCRSNCVVFNVQLKQIALGLSNGCVTIRESIKELDTRVVPDIVVSEPLDINGTIRYYGISALKYTNIGDWLLACTKKGEIKLMDVYADYQIIATYPNVENPNKIIEINPDYNPEYIKEFDFDSNNDYIQAITSENKFLFLRVESEKIEESKNRNTLQKLEFPSINCKFGFTVQGVYEGSTDPNYISTVAKAHSKKLIAAGDDDKFLKLYNYPCICENPKRKDFKGHAGHIKRIIWTPDDEKIITIAKDDKAIILWNVVEG